MNKNLLFILFFLIVSIVKTYGQNQDSTSDSIQYVGNGIIFKGITYKKPNDIRTILLKNPNQEVASLVESYKSNKGASSVLAFIGGFGIGWSLGSLISKKDFNTGIFAGGAAALIIGIVLDGSANNHLKNAISNYNRTLLDKKVSFVPIFYQSNNQQMNLGLAINF